MGAQVSHGQLETILNYIDIGKKKGQMSSPVDAVKCSAAICRKGITLSRPFCLAKQYARFPGGNFGPVLAVTTFKTMEEALEIANDTPYGTGQASGAATAIWRIKWAGDRAGRVWTNCYHAYPAHAAWGYKQSGIGRETHKMMLEHYQQTKCLLVSYSDKPLGLF